MLGCAHGWRGLGYSGLTCELGHLLAPVGPAAADIAGPHLGMAVAAGA